MKNISATFLKSNKSILNILETIVNLCKTKNIDYMVVGALARDIIISGIYGYNTIRATRDIDVAVVLENNNQFRELMQHLIDKEGWKETNEPHRLESGKDEFIDILPFGKIETRKREVVFKSRNLIEMSVIGFRESFQLRNRVKLKDGFSLNILSLANLCMLKLIAWNNRPHDRQRDIKDLAFILEKYAEIHSDEIFDSYSNLLEKGWDLYLSAKLLGIHLKETLRIDKQLKKHFLEILADAIAEKNKLLEVLTIENSKSIEQNKHLITAILEGIEYVQS